MAETFVASEVNLSSAAPGSRPLTNAHTRSQGSQPLRTPVAVFHPGTQHSWQTALALQQLGRLAWYATSIYYRPDRWPYRLADYAPEALALRMRTEFRRFQHPELDPRLVRTAGVSEWIERLAARAGFRRVAEHVDAFGNRRFAGQLNREIGGREPFALWGYNGSSGAAFKKAREHGRICVLDRTIGDLRAYDAAMDAIADRYRDWFVPTARGASQSTIDQMDEEYALADTILVGSGFAARTIRDWAIGDVASKLRVLHYCYDEALFGGLPPPRPVGWERPVRFLFLGQLIPRKGIHHVLEAIARIPRTAAELTLVGDLGVPKRTFAAYADRVTYIPTVARADVPKIMAAHDVLLFPSYFEGSALSLLEGLASGLALIQTDQAGIGVTEQTGIMLSAPDSDELYTAMMTAIEDRERLNSWRAAAQSESRNYTFERYRAAIDTLLDDLGI